MSLSETAKVLRRYWAIWKLRQALEDTLQEIDIDEETYDSIIYHFRKRIGLPTDSERADE